MAFTEVTLHVGEGYRLATGQVPIGTRIRATPMVDMVNGGVTVAAVEVQVPITSGGQTTRPIYATTDPDTLPVGNVYRIRVDVGGRTMRDFLAEIPHDAGATVDINDLDELESPSVNLLTNVYQPLDTDLTALAALSDGYPRRSSGAWAVRTAAQFRSDIGADAAALGDPAGESDGTPTALSSGRSVTVFGNAPITVTSGRYVHTPFNGANSSGYMQAQLSSDVRRIGATVEWDSGENGALALVIPGTPWSNNNYTAAGVHFVCYGNGQWHCSYWDGSSETKYLRHETHGRFADCRDGVPRNVEIAIDPASGLIWITLPDGKVVSGSAAEIATTTSTYAVWELYESDGTTTTPGEILRVWADDRPPGGQQGIAPGALVQAVQRSEEQLVPLPVAGSYFIPNSPLPPATAAPANDRLYLSPWVVAHEITLDRLAAEVTAAGSAGCTLRLGIYLSTSDARPATLVLDAGTIAADAVAVAEVTVAVTLPRGVYWLGGVVQGSPASSPTVRTLGNQHTNPLASGMTTTLASMSALSNQGFYQASVTGALPSTIGTLVPASANIVRLLARRG